MKKRKNYQSNTNQQYLGTYPIVVARSQLIFPKTVANAFVNYKVVLLKGLS